MKLAKLSLNLVLVILVLGAGSAQAQQLSPASGDQRSADRDAIRSHIDKIFQAYIQKNADVIRATHAKDWTGFQQSSRTAVHGIGEYMKDVDGYVNSPVKMTGYKMLEFDVVFYGDVGVVTYIADVTYDYQGQASTRKLRVLDVYAKLADGWNQVGSDTTLHPDTAAAELQQAQSVEGDDRQELLSAREAVWRAWFANDGPRLAELVPPELIAIEQSEKWENRDAVLAGAKDFAAKGGKLVRLEFPQTEIQMFGYTAILYSKYICEIEMDGKRSTQSGRATEMFVSRQGKWVNVGWHLDSGS
ncbi:MAG TPA: nuclear transport factor 2 family protein [Candidatus Acidoferrales bacterium]|jgi:ketosteroid isomerase-like protein|nr:nuclear transport factor 2 family protein [Candidatus Acidoferrales bacterium]